MGVNPKPVEIGELEKSAPELTVGLPPAPHTFAPGTIDEVGEIMRAASADRHSVMFWGGGTHQGIGHPLEAEVLLSSAGMRSLISWEPDDLTVVVEAGMPVGELETLLASRGQTAGLPELVGAATVGGVVSTGLSGYRRARYGPTRDRMLEVILVTGDGRIVRGGGRVVKNVTGYDLPRLATGSMGSMGFIASVCLKLWPLPESSVTVPVPDARRASLVAYRPLAVLETDEGSNVYLQGPSRDLEVAAKALGEDPRPGLLWPHPLDAGSVFSLRVPPARITDAIKRLPPGRFIAQHLVGDIWFSPLEPDVVALAGVRTWAEGIGGALITIRAPAGLGFDPWGTPPPGVALQRRLMAAFDPRRVCNPGRMPGMN